jgi:hypothetical protein
MTERAEYITGLEELAILLERHPEIPIPTHGDLLPMSIYIDSRDPDTSKMRFRDVGKFIRNRTRRPLDKVVTEQAAKLETRLGGLNGLHVAVTANRDVICKRNVIGRRKVTRTVKDPEQVAALPDVVVDDVEEIVEWECPPLGNGDDDA